MCLIKFFIHKILTHRFQIIFPFIYNRPDTVLKWVHQLWNANFLRGLVNCQVTSWQFFQFFKSGIHYDFLILKNLTLLLQYVHYSNPTVTLQGHYSAPYSIPQVIVEYYITLQYPYSTLTVILQLFYSTHTVPYFTHTLPLQYPYLCKSVPHSIQSVPISFQFFFLSFRKLHGIWSLRIHFLLWTIQCGDHDKQENRHKNVEECRASPERGIVC